MLPTSCQTFSVSKVVTSDLSSPVAPSLPAWKKKNTFYSRDLSSISIVKRRLIALTCLMKVWEHLKPLYTSSLCEWPVYESHSWGSALKSRKPCQSQGFSLGALRTDRIGQGAPEQPFWCMEYSVCSSFLGDLQTCVLLLYFSFPEYNTHLKTSCCQHEVLWRNRFLGR